MLMKLGFLLILIFNFCHGLKFPKIFTDGMVIQSAPTGGAIWVFLDGDDSEVTLTSNCNTLKNQTRTLNTEKAGNLYQIPVSFPQNEICDFTVHQGQKTVSLKDVHFGDVWVCSGQSNMEFSMGGVEDWDAGGVFNSEEEITKTAEYPNIRMFKLALMTASNPQDDLKETEFETWARSDDSISVSQFSAVCLLTARYMADVLGKDKTFGLIESSWGGTKIEPWSTREGLDFCDIAPEVHPLHPWNSNTWIYNAMIYPLTRLSIYGVLWYQGEANVYDNRDKYDCTFSQLISEWRRVWSSTSTTNKNFPFGFVQLSTIEANDEQTGTPMIRWYQTYKYGYTPNDALQNVFMAVSLDTYDREYDIHPRNKQLPSKRLATSGLNIAYGLTEYPTNGPFPVLVDYNKVTNGIQIEITYDQPFVWNSTETEGFYICTKANPQKCNSEDEEGLWHKIPQNSVTVSASENSIGFQIDAAASALAYLWETTPVLGTEALPIYANNEFKLPGAPWMIELN